MPEQATETKALTRNALTKISGILGRAQKPRWIQDFHILFSHSDPNRRYKSGEVVRGEVHIRPTKPTRVTHITLALYGYAQVFKNFNAPGDGLSKEASHTDPGRLLNSPGIIKLFTPIEKTLHGECKLPNRLLRFQFAIALPSHRLPTSIDFERGSIAYQLVATITRPTAIAPVLRCEPRKLYVNEDIDVAAVPAPKSRTVTLEPIDVRAKKKSKTRKRVGSQRSHANQSPDAASAAPDAPASPSSSRCQSLEGSRASIALSDNASGSNYSESLDYMVTSNPSTDGRANTNVSGTGSNKNSRVGAPAVDKRLVVASAEVLKGGFLPGDKVPVRIIITHTKALRSMCGVIVTLYRKTHIDTQPVLHRAEVDENGQTSVRMIVPDIYQRSMTGLGGLSLSSSGTSSTYRMDIAQAVVPLIINPQTMKADITTHVEIPIESITPTITKVRGQSIDFRYYVEVCLDLQGKLENSRFLPRLTSQPLYGFGKPSAGTSAAVPLNIAAQGNHLIDTQVIRRERPQLIAWQFHVVIGTRDSVRASKGKHRSNENQRFESPAHLPADASSDHYRSDNGLFDVQEEWPLEERPGFSRSLTNETDYYYYGSGHHGGSAPVHEIGGGGFWDEIPYEHHSAPASQATTPPPVIPMPEEPVNEKERQRLYEERLMPSVPPLDRGPSSSSASAIPSAPPAELVDGPYDGPYDGSCDGPWEADFSIRSRDADSGGPGASHRQNSLPLASGANESAGLYAEDHATDDKMELERRRLAVEASAPDYDEPEETETPSDPRATAPVPSAPALDDLEHLDREHEAASFAEWSHGNEELPRYER